MANSSVDIDCELEILYSNTAYVYVYDTMIRLRYPVPGVGNQPKNICILYKPTKLYDIGKFAPHHNGYNIINYKLQLLQDKVGL